MPAAKPMPEAVEAYIEAQPQPLRPILRAARALVRDMAPEAVETVKWGYPTWVGGGNIAAIIAHPDGVNLQLFRGQRLPDPQGLLSGSGKEMRHVRLLHAKEAQTPGVKALVRAAVRLDRESA